MSLAGRGRIRIRWLGRSSTLRLAVVLSVVFALAFVLAVFVALALGQRAIEARVDATLGALAQSADVTRDAGESDEMLLRAADDIGRWPQPMRRAAARGGGTADLNGNYRRSDVWRVLVAPDSRGTPVAVAVPLEGSLEDQELLAGILWTTAAFAVAATLGLGLWAGVLAQRRLALVNATLARLAGGDLSARTRHSRNRDDLDDIARNLDQTAEEIERLVAQTRHLSASIAHDLRTPLARLRAQIEMLPDSEGRSAALEEAAHMASIFDTIMRVARIEAGQGRDGFAPVNLAELARDLGETFGPVVEDAGKALHLEITGAAEVTGDRAMLVQAVANLVQNAVVHGGGQITLFVTGAQIGVSDNGPGVPRAAFEEIIKPMVRLDAARSSQGSGLGLALVRAVADRHSAQLTLAPIKPQGLSVSLNFTQL